jgi:hypothetical protein
MSTILIGDRFQRLGTEIVAEVATVSGDWIGLAIEDENNSMHWRERLVDLREKWSQLPRAKETAPCPQS